MNLSDIPERTAPFRYDYWHPVAFERFLQNNPPTWDILPDYQRRFAEALDRGPRMVPFATRETRVAWNDVRTAGPDAQLTFETLPEHEAIFRRLVEQWAWLQRARYDRDRRDLPSIALRITAHDWNVLIRWLPREMMMRDFGPEGALLSFRGIPMVVDP